MTNMYENMYENKLDRNYSIYITDSRKKDETFDFQKFKIIRLFGWEIYGNDLSLDDAIEQQIRLKADTDIFKESAKPKESVKKEKKITLKNATILLNGRSKVLNTFESAIFPKRKQVKGLASILNKASNHKQFKTLTPKQMIQKYQ